MARKLFLLAVVFFGAAWLWAQTKAGPFTGIITCTMCGADHSIMGKVSPARCTVDCVKSNPDKYRYALYTGKNLYVLSDQQTPEKFAGQKVKVTGTLYEKTGIIDVKKIEAAR